MSRLWNWILISVLAVLPAFAQTPKEHAYFHPSGLPRTISDVALQPATEPKLLPPDYVPPDADLKLMAAWALRHLIHDPRPALNYEPVFFIRPLHAPPAPEGHDPIVPGDTDCHMDWEFIFMRQICGSQAGFDVERGLRKRILGYVGDDYLAWQTPGARMEGDVYQGKEVPQERKLGPGARARSSGVFLRHTCGPMMKLLRN